MNDCVSYIFRRIIHMRKHHRRVDWLYSDQLVASLVRIAVSVIFALLRKTLLVTVLFQLIFGRVFIYITYSLCMIEYEYQIISLTRHNCFHG